VFTYSERPGTRAAESTDQIPVETRKRRNQVLRELGARKNLEFRRRMVGRRLSVVTLQSGALSDNFLKVNLAAGRPANVLADIEIGGLTPQGLQERSPFVVL
jgi:threonylcarbamoyladenosine tRNA methylthiotransferase MtaB